MMQAPGREITTVDLLRMIGELYVQNYALRETIASATTEREIPGSETGQQNGTARDIQPNREGARG